MIELLNELRVAMPGVQVLFGFLLTVPFQQGWRRVDRVPGERLLRHADRRGGGDRLPDRAVGLPPHDLPAAREAEHHPDRDGADASSACVALAIAMNGAVLLVTDVLFDERHDGDHHRLPGHALRDAVVRPRPRPAGAEVTRARPPSSTSTARSSTPTTSTRSPGTGRCARTATRLPMWRIHRAIGMGGDQLVAALLGDEAEEREGDDIRDAEKELLLRAHRGGPSRSRARAS